MSNRPIELKGDICTSLGVAVVSIQGTGERERERQRREGVTTPYIIVQEVLQVKTCLFAQVQYLIK